MAVMALLKMTMSMTPALEINILILYTTYAIMRTRVHDRTKKGVQSLIIISVI